MYDWGRLKAERRRGDGLYVFKGEKFGLPERFSGLSTVPADLTLAAGLGSPTWPRPMTNEPSSRRGNLGENNGFSC